MKFLYEFPGRTVPANTTLLNARALTELASFAEEAGFSGVGLDEHPAPPEYWRQDATGHDGIDPFLGMAAVAAGTTRIRLFTNLTVVPYRNPFLLAKAAATLDVLSEGRLVLGVGTGYLESEFRALGVDFERRNELFDEAIEVCIRAWTGEPVTYNGVSFAAEENTVQPRPVQQPHPPMWVGGNSQRSLRRVVAFGQGWMALPNPPDMAISRRSASLSSVEDLHRKVERLHQYATEAERTEPIDIGYFVRQLPDDGGGASALLRELSDAGVTWVVWPGGGATMKEAKENIRRFRDNVMPI
jgi:probable F420-dependent oxidoreductase